MFGSIGLSEWLAASITIWLAAQLPLGILVGFYLRHAAALSALEAVPVYARRRSWQQLLLGRAIPAHRVL